MPSGGGADPPRRSHRRRALADGMEISLLKTNIKSSAEYKAQIPSQLSQLPKLAAATGKPRRFTLGHDGKGKWNINGWRFNMNETPVTVQRGARETWLLQNNRASMPHPMHIHGFQFRVLERHDSPALEIGNGLSSGVVGLRLRYEINRQFAPYIGVERVSKFGNTANLARADGALTNETRWVAGVRIWF